MRATVQMVPHAQMRVFVMRLAPTVVSAIQIAVNVKRLVENHSMLAHRATILIRKLEKLQAPPKANVSACLASF